MKKHFLLLGFLCGLLLIVTGFKSFYKKQASLTVVNNTAIACKASSTIASATPFTIADKPNVIMVRKNIYSLTAAEISLLKAGIAAMKALPVTDPTSWQYQAAIHGTTLANNLPSWNSCQHGTQFFLSWHRMYLYFFERILRAKSGNPNFTLPYWDYQSNPVLPPDYRNSAAGNPLYDGSRFASINGGGALGSGPMVAINNALANIPFFDFQTALEGPHGSIHVAIGGNMQSISTSAKDPCFWLHHTNIDRLWEVWLRKCKGRSSPTSVDSWMKQKFTFFDETGKAVSMTGSQIVNTATQLNYRYDFPVTLPCLVKVPWWLWQWKWWQLIKIPGEMRIVEKVTKVSLKQANMDSLNIFLRKQKNGNFNFVDTAAPDKLFIELQGLKVEKAPEGVVEVYLNLPPNETPTPKSRSFAGVLDLFTPTAHNHDNMMMPIRVNISAAAQSLGLKIADLKNTELTFVVRGNTINGKEVNTNAGIMASSINLAMQRVEK